MKGYVPCPPIAAHGVVGDRRTAALVAADGTLDWLCLPDYDDDPVFAALVDAERGGWWRVGPARVALGRQRYVGDTAVLQTTWTDERGALELTDLMPWPEEQRPAPDEARRVVLRRLRCTGGAAHCIVHVAPRDMLSCDLGLRPERGGLPVRLWGRRRPRSLGIWSTHALQVPAAGGEAFARFELSAGQTAWVVLASDELPSAWSAEAAERTLDDTLRAWQWWIGRHRADEGPHGARLRRSLVTTHLLAYAPSGAMVAAPTLGLPERLGGDRNYDYRYAWTRDASLSASSLSMLGDLDGAERYLRWLARLPSRTRAPVQVAYDVHGRTRIPQRRLRGASGYRGSRPVLVGNRAYDQRQLGSLGYVADCLATLVDHGGRWRPEYTPLLRKLARHTCVTWTEADSGIWEVKRRQRFVGSKVMCWVVLDRAARLADRVGGFDAVEVAIWRATAGQIRAQVLSRGWSEALGALRRRYDRDTLDAAGLLAPVMGFFGPGDPRAVSTIDRIEERLGFDGLVYRFAPRRADGEEPLPLGEFEGAFLPCSFWLATARAQTGDIDRAEAALERAERTGGALGLFAEEVDPRDGTLLGNYPLLFSHVEHVRAVVALGRARAGAEVARPDRRGDPCREERAPSASANTKS